MEQVVIIDFGAGNVKSVTYAIEKLGYKAAVSSNLQVINKADKVIFPGVGEAQSAMRELDKRDLSKMVSELQQPVLGICLGMQLLCSRSEERDTVGLGIVDLDVVRFKHMLKIPQMGWNAITKLESELFEGIQEGTFMYFANSYYVPLDSCTIAQSEYGLSFSAAIRKDNFYGCQFHPEKSGKAGLHILNNFLKL